MTQNNTANALDQLAAPEREDRFQLLRLLEAMLFASAEPVPVAALAGRMPDGTDMPGLLEELAGLYAGGPSPPRRIGRRGCRSSRWCSASRRAPRSRPWRSSPITSR